MKRRRHRDMLLTVASSFTMFSIGWAIGHDQRTLAALTGVAGIALVAYWMSE
jgi:hypothetical protein